MPIGLREPSKTITINLPPQLKQVLLTEIEGKSLSGRIREVLSWSETSLLNLSSLRTSISTGNKHNYIVSITDFRQFEQGASQVGMSLSNYVISRLAHALDANPDVDFKLPHVFEGWHEIDFRINHHSARKQAPRYRVYQKGLDKLEVLGIERPLSIEYVVEAINFYINQSQEIGRLVEVNLMGYAFQARHNEQVVSLKLPLPVQSENQLEELARRSLVSRGAMLVRVLVFYKGFGNVATTFSQAINH